jgi:butyryl-CoA dehydrogenase
VEYSAALPPRPPIRACLQHVPTSKNRQPFSLSGMERSKRARLTVRHTEVGRSTKTATAIGASSLPGSFRIFYPMASRFDGSTLRFFGDGSMIAESERWPELSRQAEQADRSTQWPIASWESLSRRGVLRRSIPARWSGLEWSPVAQLIGCETLAAHCLTTAFILSQREAAVRLLLKGPESLQERFLPRSAAGCDLLTVGLSQLTTSRQHGGPSLVAVPETGGCFRIDGVIPWVTAADRAIAIVAGATLADGTQILFTLSPDRDGVTVEPPMALAALAGSQTAQIRCERVLIEAEDLLAGPKPQVLGAGGGGGLDTSCLAIGLARAALDLLRPDANIRPEVREALSALEPVSTRLRESLHAAAAAALPAEPGRTLELRTDATLFALHATQTALLLAKGAGFISPHPAQRLARQALFFLVWSCPRPVADGVRGALLARSSP